MITEKETTVFNSGCEAIVNTVNCRGVMGAGLALECKLRYPEMFLDYQEKCDAGDVRIGELSVFQIMNGPLIVNFPTKDHWRGPSEIEYIKKGLSYFKRHYKEWNVESIAIPPLGCNNGHLDYDVVKRIIISELKDIDINVIICVDPGHPEGKEKEMVDSYRLSNLQFICDYLEITPKNKNTLVNNKNISRFYDIIGLPGIGETTYSRLFRIFYSCNINDLDELEKRMTKTYLKSNIRTVCDELSIKGAQRSSLIAHMDVSSFTEIALIDGITHSTYRKLFDYFRDADFIGDNGQRTLF